MIAVNQAINDVNFVAARQQLLSQDAANIAGAAGN
jgi:hypothetical protein